MWEPLVSFVQSFTASDEKEPTAQELVQQWTHVPEFTPSFIHECSQHLDLLAAAILHFDARKGSSFLKQWSDAVLPIDIVAVTKAVVKSGHSRLLEQLMPQCKTKREALTFLASAMIQQNRSHMFSMWVQKPSDLDMDAAALLFQLKRDAMVQHSLDHDILTAKEAMQFSVQHNWNAMLKHIVVVCSANGQLLPEVYSRVLFDAIRHDAASCVRTLVPMTRGITIEHLCRAAEQGSDDICAMLISVGIPLADPRILKAASCATSDFAFARLVKAGAVIQDTNNSESVVHSLVQRGDTRKLQIVLDNRPELAIEPLAHTQLSYALSTSNRHVLDLLMQRMEPSDLLLTRAATLASEHEIRMILGHNKNIRNLGIAFQRCILRDMDKGVSLLCRYRDEKPHPSAIFECIRRIATDGLTSSRRRILGTLLESGCDATIAENGYTLLHILCKSKHDVSFAVKACLDYGSPVNAMTPQGETPLGLAIRHMEHYGKVYPILLKAGGKTRKSRYVNYPGSYDRQATIN